MLLLGFNNDVDFQDERLMVLEQGRAIMVAQKYRRLQTLSSPGLDGAFLHYPLV